MITVQIKTNHSSIKYSVGIAAILTLYFFLMKALGFGHFIELHLFNWLVILAGVYLTITNYKKNHAATKNYLSIFFIGTYTAALGVGIFALILCVYLLIDTEFMQLLKQSSSFGRYLNPFIIAFVVLLEGVVVGFMSSFTLDQLLKPANRQD